MSNKMRVLDLVSTHRYLRREMIQQELGSQSRTCQHMLRMMAEKDKVLNRFKLARDDSYVYYLGKWSDKWKHWLQINEFHFALKAALKSEQRVLYYQLEYRYATGQADGLYIVQTRQNGGIKFFLEADDGANQFDKVEKYERYAESRQWVREPWADPLKNGKVTFPAVVVVTPRAKEISELATKADKVRWMIFSNTGDAVKGILS